jgi:hypothetical protein
MSASAAMTSMRACAASVCCSLTAPTCRLARDSRSGRSGISTTSQLQTSDRLTSRTFSSIPMERHVDTIQSLGAFLRTRVTAWARILFEGTLLRTNSGTGYVPIDGPFPSCSTGYWLPEQPLDFDGDSRYVFRADGGRRRIRYVGVAEATARIAPETLVRVSLARAWAPSNAPAGLYLQISGWYVG